MTLTPMIWYGTRELNLVPPHFIKCNSIVTTESLFWIRNKTHGRYVLIDVINTDNILSNDQQVYFEDQKEATLYELLWSGST